MGNNKNKKFEWNDKLVMEFAKLATKGSYGIYENAHILYDKLKIFKMNKKSLLTGDDSSVRLNSLNGYGKSVIVKLSDIKKHGNIFSAEFHINRLKGKSPYILKDGFYERALHHQIKDAIYLTPKQAKEINNLYNAKKHIDIEIENIKKRKK